MTEGEKAEDRGSACVSQLPHFGVASRGHSLRLGKSDHDYKSMYMRALDLLSQQTRERGIGMLEVGCGGGMNLIHMISVLHRREFPLKALLAPTSRPFSSKPPS
jgi:hypothetical protein